MTERREPGLAEQIEGGRWAAVMREFVTNSALFPIFDAIRGASVSDLGHYMAELPHYIIFAAAFVQAYVLGRQRVRRQWRGWRLLAANLIGPALYTLIDLPLEGPNFFREPYHLVYWGFALLMGLLESGQTLSGPRWRIVLIVVQNLVRTSLLPVVYYLSEVGVETTGILSVDSLRHYLAAPGHQFIFAGALLFGLLLGLAEAQADRYAAFLRRAAHQLKQYAEWGLGTELVETSFQEPSALALQRAQRTMLFMDIRGFTAWSEFRDPATVVDLLNRYYHVAERVINVRQGHKPKFTADEVMTRFYDPLDAARTALALQHELRPLLAGEGLAVGIGLHTGEVIEGLIGSAGTKMYDIIGDAVNTAKRLESAAGSGETLVSAQTARYLPDDVPLGQARTIVAKGKHQSLTVYSLLAHRGVNLTR